VWITRHYHLDFVYHEDPSTATPQLKDSFHHEGTKVTKEDFSRKDAKAAKVGEQR
jgi:hypothetical protein